MNKLPKYHTWILVIFLGFLLALVFRYNSAPNYSLIKKLPTTQTFTLPDNSSSISSTEYCDIQDFGAVPNNPAIAKKNRLSIQNAIDSCVNDKRALFIPPGTWFTGGLYFNKNAWVIIDKNAILSFVYNPELYLPLRPSRFEGYELINFSAPLYFDNLSGGGIIGGGKIKIEDIKKWHRWDKYESTAKKRLLHFSENNVPLEQRIFGKEEDGLRPPFLQLYNVHNFVLDNITIQDSTMWTVHILYSANLLVQNLNITTKGSNTDGIVIDSSNNIILKNNILQTGDDAIVLKSGSDDDGRRIARPTTKILIQDTTINDSHGAIVIGSEMTGGIEDVNIQNTTITKADIGLRIKTRPGRGGYIRDITLDNLHAQKLRNELVRINTHYRQSVGVEDTSPELYPVLENIHIKNSTSQITKRAIVVDGFKKYPIKNLSLENITVTQQKTSSIVNVLDAYLKNVTLTFQDKEKKDKKIIIDN